MDIHIYYRKFLTVAILLLTAFSGCNFAKAALLDTGVSQELAQYRKENFGQVRYHLFFSIPEKRQEAVTGTAELFLHLKKTKEIIIDFRGSKGQISTVTLNGKHVNYTFQNEHIVIGEKETVKGENHVSITFKADDQSLNRRDDLFYTLLVPDRARTLFPCFDQPNIKALFTLTLDIPSAWKSVANGSVERIDSTSFAGRKRYYFHETEPLSTYLFSFVGGKLEQLTFNRNGRQISMYHRETDPKKIAQCPAIANEVFDALEWMEHYTKTPYPFAKYDFIVLPGFQFGGMEHTGATLYNDNSIFLNENPTLDERLRRSTLIAHETAHMWFGDDVTMAWFNDVWTKEVFANYFALRIVEPQYKEINHRLNFLLNYYPSAYAEDRTNGTTPIKQSLDNLNNAGLIYGNIIYDKSPIIMNMLAQMMGEEAFRQGLQEYLKEYAYNNATWEDLIAILSKHTHKDLKTWSHIWVNEKGMPEISCQIVGDSLIVSQKDNWNRGLSWPQTFSILIKYANHSEEIPVSFERNVSCIRMKLSSHSNENSTIILNSDGRGYGYFHVEGNESDSLFALLKSSTDEILRGSLLITLYENLLNHAIPTDKFLANMLSYLTEEKNPLLFSSALSYIGSCQRQFPIDSKILEKTLWKITTTSPNESFRLQAFRLYRSIADSQEAINRLQTIWFRQLSMPKCNLSENDYISLSYTLALHQPEKAKEIVATQLSRISNPDRIREYTFISPSVTAEKSVRDSVFTSLMKAENRRIEPWASATLANLNYRLRQKEALCYIRPALEKLQEIQRTGDIFFPTNWVRALLGGHTSAEAKNEVDVFLSAHPDFPTLLGNKIKQQADHLYRINR